MVMRRKTGGLTPAICGPGSFFPHDFSGVSRTANHLPKLPDRRSEAFVGLANYKFVFTSAPMLTAFKNNLIWLIFFTAGTVGLGLLFAI